MALNTFLCASRTPHPLVQAADKFRLWGFLSAQSLSETPGQVTLLYNIYLFYLFSLFFNVL